MSKLLSILFFAFLSSTTFATETYSDWSDGMTFTEFNDDKEWQNADVRIAYYKSGEKYLHFLLTPLDEDEKCRLNIPEDGGKEIVFFVNNQAIKGTFFCSKFTDINTRVYTFAARTTAGEKFIINEFLNSNLVKIETRLKDFNANAKGFAKEWNRRGDKAL